MMERITGQTARVSQLPTARAAIRATPAATRPGRASDLGFRPRVGLEELGMAPDERGAWMRSRYLRPGTSPE